MKKNIAIIGGGPAGLMAAEILGKAGHSITIYDRMSSLGRKFLMAGRGGLNLTHSEPIDDFIKRYGAASKWLEPYIRAFTPTDLRNWAEELGQETYIGSSGRIFPKAMKAAPLLRAWLKRLDQYGVKYFPRHNWLGFENDSLKFSNEGKEVLVKPDATLLALGGASWPRLGSDGSWVKILSDIGVEISALRPANSGFIVQWSEYFSSKFAGTPLKSVALNYNGASQQGELMITKNGLEGGALYAMSSILREDIAKNASVILHLDLRPNISLNDLQKKLAAPQGNQSLSNFLRKAGFPPVVISLLHEVKKPEDDLASLIKNLPIKLTATAGIERAISTAGGIKQNALDENFMLKAKPGTFAVGEMLDWEAPTGGYLLQACFSTAAAASSGMQKFLDQQ